MMMMISKRAMCLYPRNNHFKKTILSTTEPCLHLDRKKRHKLTYTLAVLPNLPKMEQNMPKKPSYPPCNTNNTQILILLICLALIPKATFKCDTILSNPSLPVRGWWDLNLQHSDKWVKALSTIIQFRFKVQTGGLEPY